MGDFRWDTQGEPPRIKIHDKRRFTSDGDPAPAASAEARDERPEAAMRGPELAVGLAQELEVARKRIDDLARAYQAGERDREEFKARMSREREQMIDVERGNAAVALLEAIDELDLCLQAADESALARGVRLIRDGLLKKAGSSGLERVELLGTAFDPLLAEASDMELTRSEAEDGRVVGVLKACYQIGDRVVRPGRVRVAKYVKS